MVQVNARTDVQIFFPRCVCETSRQTTFSTSIDWIWFTAGIVNTSKKWISMIATIGQAGVQMHQH